MKIDELKLLNFLPQEYPVTLTQFLFYLYHNVHDFMPVFMGSNVLTALAGTLFPLVAAPSPPTSPADPPTSPGDPPTAAEKPTILHLPYQV